MWILLLLFPTLISGQVAPPIPPELQGPCFEPGECQGVLVDSKPADDPEICRQKCKTLPTCFFFTQYDESKVCELFGTCDTFDTDCTESCFSGAKECEPRTCFEQGQCVGIFIGGVSAYNANGCLKACDNDVDCAWFVFKQNELFCELYETCGFVPEDRGSDLAGEKGCQPQPG